MDLIRTVGTNFAALKTRAMAGMQGVEIGDAIDPEDDRLAVENEMLLPDLPCGLDDPRLTSRPVVTASSGSNMASTFCRAKLDFHICDLAKRADANACSSLCDRTNYRWSAGLSFLGAPLLGCSAPIHPLRNAQRVFYFAKLKKQR